MSFPTYVYGVKVSERDMVIPQLQYNPGAEVCIQDLLSLSPSSKPI